MSLTSRLTNSLGLDASSQSHAAQQDELSHPGHVVQDWKESAVADRTAVIMDGKLDPELKRPPYLHVGSTPARRCMGY